MMQVKVRFLVSIKCFYIIMWMLGHCRIVVASEIATQPIVKPSTHVNGSSSNSSTHNVSSNKQAKRINTPEEGGFPDNFLFGVSTSALQIEGAWNVSDKSESNWEFMTHQWPETIEDGSNADIAANSYYMYKTDIKLMKEIGVNSYRMSLSWPRILPNGFTNHISKDGIRYYNDVINELLANGIEPHVTIFHWDLPQNLQELGGWTNPLIIDWFVDYARVVFTAFGDRVKLWSTINEPSILCGFDFKKEHIPAKLQSGISDYLCGHYTLLAHGRAYRMYNKEFRAVQNGRVGICLNLRWAVEYGVKGKTDGTESWLEWRNNWFLHPLFTDNGDYPNIMKERISEYSEIQGFTKSRLPKFSDDEIEMIKYSSDFLGVNFYAADVIERWTDYNPNATVSTDGDMGMRIIGNMKASPFANPHYTPLAFTSLIQQLNDNYNISIFYITENGYPDLGQLADYERAKYHHAHLTEVSKLISQGINIHGYFAWSLLDNFEWTLGYSRRYGLFSINFTDPHRKRIPKFSSSVISDIYKTKKVSKPSRYFNVTCESDKEKGKSVG